MKLIYLLVIGFLVSLLPVYFQPSLANILSTGEVRVFPVLGDGINSDKWEVFVIEPMIIWASSGSEAQNSFCTRRTRASNGFFWAQPPSFDPTGCDRLGIRDAKSYSISKFGDSACGVSAELGGGESCVVWKPTVQPPTIQPPAIPVLQAPSGDLVSQVLKFFSDIWVWFKMLLGGF